MADHLKVYESWEIFRSQCFWRVVGQVVAGSHRQKMRRAGMRRICPHPDLRQRPARYCKKCNCPRLREGQDG